MGLHLGDCRDVPLPAAGSVDLVIADLPYETTRNAWDVEIPLEWIWATIPALLRSSSCPVVLFGQGLFGARLMLSSPWFRYDLVWHKDRPSGFLNAKRQPLRDHEQIFVFCEGAPYYSPQMWEGKATHSIGKTTTLNQSNYGRAERRDAGTGTLKYPRSVLAFKRPHPPVFATQKPVDLCKWLIETYCPPGGTVFDFCMGSGTAGVAAHECGREFIGIERDPATFHLAEGRVRKVGDTAIQAELLLE